MRRKTLVRHTFSAEKMLSPIEEDDDWVKRFISIVREKPAIYNYHLPGYSDRILTNQQWSEVCEAMFPKWSDLTSSEKSLKDKEIRQRWRNLRTCFKREWNKQRNGPSGKRRRKYIYYDQLLFLLPHIEDKVNVNQGSSRQSEEVCYYDEEDGDTGEETFSYQPQHEPPEKPKKNANPVGEDSLSCGGIDEDKTFLLSLVPSFKKMNDDEKIKAKMEFLAVIRQINQSRNVKGTNRPAKRKREN